MQRFNFKEKKDVEDSDEEEHKNEFKEVKCKVSPIKDFSTSLFA